MSLVATELASHAKSADPKVSVIMNCLNGEQFVRGAIRSVYEQTYKNWEIIFLDNASNDATPSIAQGFDEKLRYFRNDNVVPLGEARNQALKQASGDFIAFLDSDDSWLPQKLEKQIPMFRERPRLGLVFSDTYLEFQDSGLRTEYFSSHHYKPPRGLIFPSLLLHYAIPMLTTVIRRECLDKMPQWFDGSYRVCDDFDFFMRVAYDWECDYLDESLAKCLIHGEAVTAKMHRYGPAEMIQTIEKFRLQQPDFDKRYERELRIFLKQVSYKQGKSLWREGQNQAARVHFQKHLLSPKFLVSYLATVLPFSTAERLGKLLGR